MKSSLLAEDSVISVAEGQLASKLNDEVVILNLTSGIYFGLDQVGARVWELLQQHRRFGELRAAILREFDVEPLRCTQDLSDLIGRMESEGIVRIAPGT
jgi:hypothetical protein